MKPSLIIVMLLLVGGALRGEPTGAAGTGLIAGHPSIQAALDANPGQPIHLPAGVYRIERPLVISSAGSGILGEGTIIQTNDDADIIQVKAAAQVRLEGITLLREHPRFSKSARAICSEDSPYLQVRNVSIRGNRATPTAVYLRTSDYVTIEGCTIVDFKTITIDDRMENPLYRYAFRAIDGHGIYVLNCKGARILRNHIIETELRPTREIQRQYELGRIVQQAPELGPLASYGVRDNFVFIWHQGGGILLNDGQRMAFALLDGNYIENAAQGMDLHGDFLIVTNNHVTNTYMGMKVFHGGRGVVISNNVFHQSGKYGILLRPGSESWPASAADAAHPAREANVERGIIIANNIITDMGYGDEDWRLRDADPEDASPVGIRIGTGPLERNPRLMDLIIQGNLVYDRGRDEILVEGQPTVAPPRYKWAIWFDEKWRAENVRLNGNILHPGSQGVSNLSIQP